MSATASTGRAPVYTTDLRYPSSFVFGQTPLQLVWAAAAAGAATIPLDQPFTYCDLGCGDGITVNVLAAAYPQARFVGIDLNTEHLDIAREMARRGAIDNVAYLESSISGLASVELPAFDFIAVHGVYSWVDDAVRESIHAFVGSRLRPGGLACVQYSCLPGAALHDPVLNAVRALSESASGDSAARVRSGLDALRRLVPGSRFFATNPGAVELVHRLGETPIGPLAHDALNRRPHSFYFKEISANFESLGLRFVGSGNLKLNYPELMMPAAAHAVYQDLTAGASVELREEILGLVVDASSRCDVFRKPDQEMDGSQNQGAAAVARGIESLRNLYLQPTAAAAGAETRRRAAQGTAIDIESPLHLAVLAVVGGGAVTIGEVLDDPTLLRFPRSDVEQALAQLYMLRCLDVLVQAPRPATFDGGPAWRFASPLNRALLDETLLVPEPIGFASPVLGTAIMIPPDARVRLLALVGGDLERFWNSFRRHERRMLDSRGNPVRDFAGFRVEIEASLPAFARNSLPDLLRVGVLEAAA